MRRRSLALAGLPKSAKNGGGGALIQDSALNRANTVSLIIIIRPLQFDYLSYKLFLEKEFCQTPKNKIKSRLWYCLTDESGLEIVCQTPKKKK